MKPIVCLLLMFIAITCRAQQAVISAFIMQENNIAIPGANVSLHKLSDSSLVKAAITDKSGSLLIENLKHGNYLLRITATGYVSKIINISFTAGEEKYDAGKIILDKKATDMAEVTVTARKPFIQRLSDRIVVNVDNSIVNAGNSAFEVLEKSPGVTVDNNDAISLKGRQGVIIMIDGKPSPIGGADLANYLRSLPANSIDRIEIIANPSSKYDAAGNSGIIDIRLKKDQRMGTNGNLNLGYGQGFYHKMNGGLGLNHRNKKLNVFGTYNYGDRKFLNNLFLDRNFYTDGQFTGSDLKEIFTSTRFFSNNIRLGADFFPNKKTIVGFVVNSNFTRIDRNGNNSALVIDANHDPAFRFQTLSGNDDKNNNSVANLNYKYSFNNKGKELTADADYGVYNNQSISRASTAYYKMGGGTQQPEYILDGNQKGKLKLFTAKTDFVNPLKNNASLELGFKTSFVSSDNDAKFFDASSGTPQNDPQKTNHFLYDENNNAAYVNFKKEFNKYGIQLGLRAEQTNIETFQQMGSRSWDSSYLQFFPSAFFNYKLKENHTLGLSVSRRINRPGYSQLNPFLFLIDVTTYSTGNPGLLPQFTWAYELSYTMKSINFALSYSHTDKNQNVVIARFNDLFPASGQNENVTVQIPINLSSSDYVGFSVSAPVKINTWWSMINNLDVFYNHFNGILGTTQLNNGKPAADVRVNNAFSLKKGWSAELNATFNSGGQYGFMVSDPQWSLAAGVQKLIWNKKGTIRLNVSDIFWTNLPKAVITYDNYIERWNARRDTRVANLSFSYRFGKNTVQAARKRTTASEEERQRAGN